MRRILLISGSYPPMRCGVGDYSARLAQSLSSTGKVRVGVLTGMDISAAGTTLEFIRGPGWRLRSAIVLMRAVSKWKPDLVHIQYPTLGYGGSLLPWFLPLLFRVVGIPVVQSWHEFLPMFGHAHSFLLCLPCRTVIVVRPKFRETLTRWYRWLTRNIDINFIGGGTTLPRSNLSDSGKAELRRHLVNGLERLVTYFGFATRNKGIEQLFQIADPLRDRLVLVCELQESDAYQREILAFCNSATWQGRVLITGFLPAQKVSEILDVSDAVLLPFTEGGGDWNSTVLAAREQGTLVVTTSVTRKGYEEASNTFYCCPGDSEAMARALTQFAGKKLDAAGASIAAWSGIADEHLRVYGRVLNMNCEKSA